MNVRTLWLAKAVIDLTLYAARGVAAMVEMDLPDGFELHSYDDEGWPIYRSPGRVSKWRQLSILPFFRNMGASV